MVRFFLCILWAAMFRREGIDRFFLFFFIFFSGCTCTGCWCKVEPKRPEAGRLGGWAVRLGGRPASQLAAKRVARLVGPAPFFCLGSCAGVGEPPRMTN